ncbi:hypothetical protein L596_027461 [Steinernema carpocapsae]|uniref:Uncharacterized protein n=1 Tax=Steinernema carpocapsae TaxID=34508 RepID=A0A4U5LVJ7_STECR|nr:hypothetical protein L596_027461 [Steinernema carpocapsae]
MGRSTRKRLLRTLERRPSDGPNLKNSRKGEESCYHQERESARGRPILSGLTPPVPSKTIIADTKPQREQSGLTQRFKYDVTRDVTSNPFDGSKSQTALTMTMAYDIKADQWGVITKNHLAIHPKA